jgi:cholesterol oxidase
MSSSLASSRTKTQGRPLQRLSSPIPELSGHAAVVVVGSGYGGAITASRLARAGQQVWVLERGRELHPGEFPDTLPEALGDAQLHHGSGQFGSRTALYDLRARGDMNVFVGCGLGGTSLVNANVALRADPRVFERSSWPAELRASAGSKRATPGPRRCFSRSRYRIATPA